MKNLNVLYQSSSAYAIPAAVSICSLLENNRDLLTKIWFIDDGLTDEDRTGLVKLAERYNRELHFLSGKETEKFLDDAGVLKWNESYATFYKLFLCQQIPDTDRVLYIDADTVVCGNLSELCEIDLEGFGCAMVASAVCGELKKFLGLKYYYNAGIELLNLKYWKENRISKKIIQLVTDAKTFMKATIVADESLINVALRDKIKKLPLKYNCEATWWLWGHDKIYYNRLGWKTEKDAFYSPNEIKDAFGNPKIIHFVDLTTGRPWDFLNDHPFKQEFEKYLQLLVPWKRIGLGVKGIGGSNKVLLAGKWILKKILPFKIRKRIGFSQHKNSWKQRIASLSNE